MRKRKNVTWRYRNNVVTVILMAFFTHPSAYWTRPPYASNPQHASQV
jgi:hypothetical protein